jgi:hypothetical protein
MTIKTKSFPWIYAPGLMDACDPTVIKGAPIARYARVRIAREAFPPQLPKVFVIIEDKAGNLQSVWKAALTR